MTSAALKRGDRLRWRGNPDLSIRVDRVAKDQSWADIFVYDNRTRTSWTKRQPLLEIDFEVISNDR